MSFQYIKIVNNLKSNILYQTCRGMATEKQILMRINSTTNIAKITKSMKMVSAAKMRGAENRLKLGRPFSKWMDTVGKPSQEIEKDGLLKAEEYNNNNNINDNVLVVITSDRGLCGGCNSYVAKATRRQLSIFEGTDKNNKKNKLFIMGEKGRSQLRRLYGDSFIGSVTECWGSGATFSLASAIAESILTASDIAKTNYFILFNKFQSAIAYNTSIRPIILNTTKNNKETDSKSIPALSEYELEPDNREELLMDLKEWHLASSIFHGMIEASTSEESARMAAMENATSNANELIDTLRLKYNKARQSRITTELIEIISGAASLDSSS